MAEIGVKRLGAGDGEAHAAEDREGDPRMGHEKGDAVVRVEGEENARIVGDMEQAEGRHGDEPD